MSFSAPPRISVLVPAFNAAATLESCLRSVQRQTERDWECRIVDDGSTDGTADNADELARDDPRFIVLRRAHHGLVDTLNAGLARCRGDYVARMDADDVMHRNRLELQLAALERDPDLVAVGSHVRVIPRAGLRHGTRAYESWINGIESAQDVAREAWVECPVVHPTWTIRREPLLDLGYRDRGWPEDYDLLLRLLVRGDRVGVVPRRLLCWRDHPARLSRTAEAYRLECFTECKAEFLARSFLDGHERYVLWGYGPTGRAMRGALLRHDKRPSYIVELHPRRLGNRIHGAPVIPPEALAQLPRGPLIASVSGAGPREEIRAALRSMGFEELRDFVCTA